MYFSMDKYFSAYERRIYSIGDMLGQAGGLYGTALIVGGLFVSAVANRLFVSSILNKLYQIDIGREESMSKDKAKKLDPIRRSGTKRPANSFVAQREKVMETALNTVKYVESCKSLDK